MGSPTAILAFRVRVSTTGTMTAGLERSGHTGKRTVFLAERTAVRIPEIAYHETALYDDGT